MQRCGHDIRCQARIRTTTHHRDAAPCREDSTNAHYASHIQGYTLECNTSKSYTSLGNHPLCTKISIDGLTQDFIYPYIAQCMFYDTRCINYPPDVSGLSNPSGSRRLYHAIHTKKKETIKTRPVIVPGDAKGNAFRNSQRDSSDFTLSKEGICRLR
jgi:hypothetical protein